MSEFIVYYSIIGGAVIALIVAQLPLWRRRAGGPEPVPVPPEMVMLVQEFMKTAPDIIAAVTEKEQALRFLLRQADEKIAALRALRAQAEPAAPLPKPPQKFSEVFELRQQGLTPVEIAEQLNLELGKVELLCNLQSKL